MSLLKAQYFRGLVLIALMLAALAHILVFLSPFEDSFITFRYADHIAAGHGFVYNIGEKAVEGSTSFSWTMILAAVSACGLPVPLFATFFSIAAALGLLVVTQRFARGAWFAERQLSFSVEMAAMLLVASHGTFSYYAGTGMETTFFACVLVFACLKSVDANRGWSLGALWLFALMTRPEALGYAGLALMWGCVLPQRRAASLRAALVCFLGGSVLLGARYWYFGELLPNTYYAKASLSGDLLIRGWGQLFEGGVIYFLWGLPLVWFFLLRRLRGLENSKAFEHHSLAILMTLGALVNQVFVGGDTFAFYRFFLPVIPLIAVSLSCAFFAFLPRRRAALLAVLLASWNLGASFLPRPTELFQGGLSEAERVSSVGKINSGYFLIGEFLKENYPRQTRLATNAAGIVPYVSELPTIDMLGLNDAHIAHRKMVIGSGVAGHEKHDAQYVLSLEPDIIILGLPSTTGRKPQMKEAMGLFSQLVNVLPGDGEILASSMLSEHYTIASEQVSNGRWFTYLERKGTTRITSEAEFE